LCDEQIEAEQVGAVEPGLRKQKPGVPRKNGQLVRIEFVGVLGANRLAPLKVRFEVDRPDAYDLLLAADEVDLDPPRSSLKPRCDETLHRSRRQARG
jgi:hypothetical protein